MEGARKGGSNRAREMSTGGSTVGMGEGGKKGTRGRDISREVPRGGH